MLSMFRGSCVYKVIAEQTSIKSEVKLVNCAPTACQTPSMQFLLLFKHFMFFLLLENRNDLKQTDTESLVMFSLVHVSICV